MSYARFIIEDNVGRSKWQSESDNRVDGLAFPDGRPQLREKWKNWA